MNTKCIIIFSGFNQRAVIAFIRTLEKNKLQYGIIATSNGDTILDTEYASKVIVIRQFKVLDLNDIKNTILLFKQKIIANEYIIAPTTEALNRFLLLHRNEIENSDVKIPLVSKELYEKISDKYCFGRLCTNNNIQVPSQFADSRDIQVPFVAKPLHYFASDGLNYPPILVFSETDKINFFSKYNSSDFYFQDYIEGKSYYLLYYFHRNGNVYKFSQQNIIQQPEGKSIVAAISSQIHLGEESAKYEALFKSIEFNGLVMIELMERNGTYYMIEANPRFWGPSQLFVDAGMNFFDAFLHDYGLIKNSPEFIEHNKIYNYFWFGGIIQTFKSKKMLKFHESNEVELLSLLTKWLMSDIYRRNDTQNIFKNELL